MIQSFTCEISPDNAIYILLVCFEFDYTLFVSSFKLKSKLAERCFFENIGGGTMKRHVSLEAASSVHTMVEIKKFGFRDKLGYLFGDFGNDFFFILVSSFLMVYYTDIFGISAVTVGMLFLVARLWDAVADVTLFLTAPWPLSLRVILLNVQPYLHLERWAAR
jgi:hypothetical protein